MKSQHDFEQCPRDYWEQILAEQEKEYLLYLRTTYLHIGKRQQPHCRMSVAKPSAPRNLKAMRSVSRNR